MSAQDKVQPAVLKKRSLGTLAVLQLNYHGFKLQYDIQYRKVVITRTFFTELHIDRNHML